MNYLGQFNHQHVYIHIPERRAVDASVPNPTLFVGDDSMMIDIQRLDGRVLAVLPRALARANAEDFAPFIRMAYAHNLFR